MINDYEELLNALSTDQKGAANLFENIVNGILTENPKSYRNAVDGDWNNIDVTARLVTDSPIPLNEEQRKILSAIRKPECNYISVQGPPGTGKSHTITAIAFDGILSGQTVLVLSDKTEALDVVQDKLKSVLAKVRHGDDEFPNPILRLGKTGNTYTRLMASSAKEKITRHYQAEVQHSAQLAQETSVKTAALKSDIDKTVAALSAIKIEDIDQFHGLEAELDAARPNVTTILRQADPETAASHIQTLLTTIDAKACAAVLAKLNAKDSKPTVSSLREKQYVALQRLPGSELRIAGAAPADRGPFTRCRPPSRLQPGSPPTRRPAAATGFARPRERRPPPRSVRCREAVAAASRT